MKKNKVILVLIGVFLLFLVLFYFISNNKSDYGKEQINIENSIDSNDISFIEGTNKVDTISFEPDDKLPSEFKGDESNIVFSNDDLVIYSSGDNMSLGTASYSTYTYESFDMGIFVKSKKDLNISNENFVVNTNNGSFYSSQVKTSKKGFLGIDDLQYLNITFLVDPTFNIYSLNLKIKGNVYELKSDDIDKLIDSIDKYEVGESKDGASTVSSGGYYI